MKHGTMAKKFNVVAGDARDRPPCGTTHNTAYIARRSKEDLKEEVGGREWGGVSLLYSLSPALSCSAPIPCPHHAMPSDAPICSAAPRA